jgi:hypothetical protein
MKAAEPAEDELVYLHYTQAELDRNFDQRGWIERAGPFLKWGAPRKKTATRPVGQPIDEGCNGVYSRW